MHTPTVVSELDDTEAVEQVFRLYVPVDDVLGVNVLQSLAHLIDVARSLLLREVALVFQLLVQLALRAVLQD